MAYQSAYAGSEIDQAVSDVQNRIWQPVTVPVSTDSWTQNSGDSEHTASFKYTPSAISCESSGLPPMVWFMDGSGNRYYCDYKATVTGETCSITFYSNVKITGTFYLFGIIKKTTDN